MSIVSIPNQPILFSSIESCTNYGINKDKQLVDFTDQIFLQIELDCGGEAITNQSTNRTVWTYNGALICNDGTTGGSFVATIQPDEVYTVFEVQVIVPVLNSGTLNVAFEGGQNYNITSAGTYTLYFNSDIMLTDLTPEITFSGDDFNGCFLAGTFQIAFVRGIFAEHSFYVIDKDDNVVIDEPDYIQAVENTLTIGFNFNSHSLEEGCYRVAYSDQCDNTCGQFRIDNGQFLYDGGWELSNGATINATTRVLNLFQTGGFVFPQAINEKILCENKEYYVEISVISITGGSVFVSIGNSQSFGDFIEATTPGVYNTTMTSSSGGELVIQLQAGNLDSAVIDYVLVRYNDEQAPEISGYSNTLSVGDYSSCDYVKLEGCNGNDSFGFKFQGSGFVPGIRVQKRFFRAQYITDVEVYRNIDGTYINNFADVEKIKTLSLEQQPEYFFDFLSILVYFDNFYINGETYVLNESDFPSIQYDDANESGNILLELKRKTDLLRKVNCLDIDADCLPTVLGGDENNFLLQNEDRFILQNGDNFDLQE